MYRNNVLNFNPEEYLHQLSPFAKSVLHVLMKQWESSAFPIEALQNTNNFRQRCSTEVPVASNRIQTSHDSHASLTISISSERNVSTCVNEVPFNLNINPNEVLTSEELIQTLNAEENNAHNNENNLIHNKINNDFIDEGISDDKEQFSECNVNMSEEVTWNDMFDTNFFVDNINPTEEKKIKRNMNTVGEIEETFTDVENNEINTCVAQDIKIANKKLVKRKSQMLDMKTKKIKNGKNESAIKVSYRKEKYTKTVKNWLNNVSPNIVEEILTENREENTVSGKGRDILKKPHTNKKFVQAQLANKEGVMKFRKPKNFNMDITGKPDKLTKEKNTKPKFIVPIKSQIPIKDIIYEITIINSSNYREVSRKHENKYTETVAVLCYSNGFCQLNSHYANDMCDPEGIMFYVNNKHYFYSKKDSQTDLSDFLKILLNNKLICYDGKKLLIYLKTHLNYHIETAKIELYDTMIGGCLLDPDGPLEHFTDLQKLVSFTPDYTIATECDLQKCAWYITVLKDCANKLKELLIENSLWNVYVKIEMRLIPIIADMEIGGVTVDTEKLQSMEKILEAKMKTVEQECYNAAGKCFQINSTAQVRAILYDELQLDSKCNVKIKETITKGAKSTSEAMLRSLIPVHPLPKLILEYRRLHKAHATFVTGIAQHIRDGTIRPTWLQAAAATGRIASHNPNLQAIPKTNFNLIMHPEENQDTQELNFRSVYIARAGYTLLAADFKHIECRVFAYIAADTELLDALKSPDIFRVLAAKWLKKPEEAVSKEDRERTKRIVYASLYGAGTRKLMDILNVGYEQALSIVSSFNRTFPSLKTFGRNLISICEQNGGRLSTLSGRMRNFKHITSNDFTLKSQAQRQTINFMVQGTAADLCKMAMILTETEMKNASPSVRARLVLQIHDELVWEVAEHDADRAAAIVKGVMERCGRECGVDTVLPVAVATGRDWGRMRPLSALIYNI